MIGKKFGRLLVIDFEGVSLIGKDKQKVKKYTCLCDCGNTKGILITSLKSGATQSCGCYNKEQSIKKHTKHGSYNKPEYKVWTAMKMRCRNPNNSRAHQYGGRGITYCPEWEQYENFIKDMGERPGRGYSLDRIDNDKGYCKENCKWSTPHEQMTNRTVTRFVDTPEGKIPLATLAHKYNIPANTLRARVLKGWSLERCLTEEVAYRAPRIKLFQ